MSRLFRLTAFLLLLSCLQIEHSIAGLDYQVTSPQFVKQISQPTITSLMEDSFGNLWIGTQEGLYNFDGTSLKRFYKTNSEESELYYSDIRGAVETANGEILIAAYGVGIIIFSPIEKTSRLLFPEKTHLLRSVSSISIDTKNAVWITTRNSAFRVGSKLALEEIPVAPHSQPDYFELLSITHTNEGKTYIGGSFGLAKYSANTKSFQHITTSFDGEHIVALSEGPQDSLFAATKSGDLFQFSAGRNTTTLEVNIPAAASLHISKLLVHRNKLYVATNQGIYVFAGDLSLDSSISAATYSNLNDSIMSLLFSGDDLWIGTYQGLFAATTSEVELFNESNSGIHPEVLSFAQDSNNQLWVGTYNGLYRLSPRTGLHEKFENIFSGTLADHRIMSLAADQGNLWIGYQEHGVQVVNPDNGDILRPLPEETNNFAVTAILPTKENSVWLATYNMGLHRYSAGSLKHFDSIPEPTVMIIEETSSGRIYVGTERNLYRHSPDLDEFVDLNVAFSNLTSPPRILSLAEHPSGVIYVGTKDNGLFYVESVSAEGGGSWNAKPVNESGAKTTIYTIEIDDLGQIWTSTENGIRIYDSDSKPIRHMLVRDGLQASDFNFGASLKDTSDNLLFGGVNGYNKIDPKKVSTQYRQPPLRLTGVRTLSSDVSINFKGSEGKILLEHNDDFIMFQFSVRDYIAHDAYKYRYRLIGFQEEWVNSGHEHSATYTNLPSGTYYFEVQASNQAGAWTEQSTIITVEIASPPWMTWWAICIYSAVIILLLLAFKKFYDTIVIKEKALSYAKSMASSMNVAETELIDQLESHLEEVKSLKDLYSNNIEIFEEIASHPSVGIRPELSIATTFIRIIDLYYSNKPPSAELELRGFAELAIAETIAAYGIDPSRLVSINRIPKHLVPAESSPIIAAALFELVRIHVAWIEHTDIPVCYLELELHLSSPRENESMLNIVTSHTPYHANLETFRQLLSRSFLEYSPSFVDCQVDVTQDTDSISVEVSLLSKT